MRWRGLCDGDVRIVRKFLLFPKRIGREVRWLEFANIEQKYHFYKFYWADIRYVDQQQGQE